MKSVLIIIFSALLLLSCSSKEGIVKSNGTFNRDKGKTALNDNDRAQFAILFFDANKAKILGNFEEAINLFNQALKIDPNSAVVHYELSKLYAEKKEFNIALPYAEKARANDPQNIWYATLLSQLYSETGEFEMASVILKDIIEKNPNKWNYYFELAGNYASQKKYEEAIEIYNEIEKKAGLNEEVSFQKQALYMEMKNPQKAIEEIEKLIELNPEEIRYLGMLAEFYESSGQDEKALATYEEMRLMEPDNALVLLSLAEYYRKSGDKEKSNDLIQQAFENPDLNIDIKVNILLNYFGPSMGNEEIKEQAYQLLDRVEKAHPTEAKTYALYGDFLYNDNKLEEAREKFRQAVSLDKNRPPIWSQILLIDSRLNDFDAMLSESEKALELFPSQPQFYLFNGIALSQKQQYLDAVDVLMSGKNLIIDDDQMLGQVLASLGDAYHELGEHSKSDEAYEKSLGLNPDNVVVLNNYSYYLSLRGTNLDQAEKMAKKANDLQPDQGTFQDTYGWVLYKKENYANAEFWLKEALKNGGGNDPTVLEHYGDVLYKLDRKEEALEYWNKAKENGGDSSILERKISEGTLSE